jgi:hypothetical protein
MPRLNKIYTSSGLMCESRSRCLYGTIGAISQRFDVGGMVPQAQAMTGISRHYSQSPPKSET